MTNMTTFWGPIPCPRRMSEECLQLVADVDGALRSMEHWVAAARDGASQPTEALWKIQESDRLLRIPMDQYDHMPIVFSIFR